MTSKLSLPVDLQRGDGPVRTASTPTEYWNLRGAGYVEVDGEGVATLSPQQKAARTRAANKAKAEGEGEPDPQKPDDDITGQAGDANPDE